MIQKMSNPNISEVIVWDKVYWRWEKRAYTVMARNHRFIIISKPFNPKKTFQYSIIDLERKIMWPDNFIFGTYDYLNKDECEQAIQKLQEDVGKIDWMDISERRSVPIIDFDKIIRIETNNNK